MKVTEMGMKVEFRGKYYQTISELGHFIKVTEMGMEVRVQRKLLPSVIRIVSLK